MGKIKIFFETLVNNKPMFIVGVAVLAASILVAVASYEQRYNLSNIDGISYMSIASQYANGEVDYALNGYWSPMTSWLIIPFIWLGIEPALGFRAINALAGIFIITVGAVFVWSVAKKQFLSAMTYVVMVTLLLVSSYKDSLSPDIIALSWVLLFTFTIIEVVRRIVGTMSYRKTILAGSVLGLVGALGYFTKLYLLPVFLGVMFIVFIVSLALLFTKHKGYGKRLGVITVASISVMVICMVPWVGAISGKYGYVTIGSSFSNNVTNKFTSLVGESGTATSTDKTDSVHKSTTDKYGLISPPNETATDPSEERTPYREELDNNEATDTDIVQKSNLAKGASTYISSRINHVPYYLKNLTDIWLFTLLSPVVLLILVGFKRHKKIIISKQIITVLILLNATLIVYASGYAAMTTQSSSDGESRYFLPVVLLAVISFVIMNPYVASLVHKVTKWPEGLTLAIVTTASILAMASAHPIELQSFKGKSISPSGLHEASYLMRQDLDIKRGDNVTSNNNRQAHRLSYMLGLSQYDLRRNGKNMDGLGQKPIDLSNETLSEVFEENSIEYYFEFRPVLADKPDVTGSNFELIGEYDVGKLACEDARNAPHEQCTLYVIKPVYD